MNASLSDSILNNNEIITDITIELVNIDSPSCTMHLNIPLITYFKVNQVKMLIRVIPNEATRSEAQ